MQTRVAVIGGGIGGISAAISLASRGYDVHVFEKNGHIGGKLNSHKEKGFYFDLGPSILTLPQVFRSIFEGAGKRMEDYVTIRKLDHHWRNFFEDGSVVDLVSSFSRQRELLSGHDAQAPRQFESFMRYACRQYRIVRDPYIFRGADTPGQIARMMPPWNAIRLGLFQSMSTVTKNHFSSDYLRDIFGFFSKYVGSSAERAPAFMTLLPWVQYRYGLWRTEKGMSSLGRGLQRLFADVGGRLHLETEVKKIESKGRTATGIRLHDGTFFPADVVISNMEVIPASEHLLGSAPQKLDRFSRFEPSCSGLVIHLGVKRTYPNLAHHNFLFSADQHSHYRSVFDKHELPRDPTLYLVAPTRSEPSLAPRGCEIIKVLPHIPHINSTHPYGTRDLAEFRERVLTKCERMCLPGLRKHIVVEHTLTPFDIKDLYYSNRGSIYGVVSDRFRNLAFKARKRSRKFSNLFFVGGSVNPGGGMPMVALSGIQAASMVDKVAKH